MLSAPVSAAHHASSVPAKVVLQRCLSHLWDGGGRFAACFEMAWPWRNALKWKRRLLVKIN